MDGICKQVNFDCAEKSRINFVCAFSLQALYFFGLRGAFQALVLLLTEMFISPLF
jgi:hypothetical protein